MNQIELARLDLNLLVTLAVMLDEKSLTRAGQRLGRTPSAMSHALARLREAFGDPLFVRVGHVLEPTAGAQALRAPLEAVLAGASALLRREPVAPARLRRTFRVVASDYLQRLVLPTWVARLRAEAPAVDLQLLSVPTDLSDHLAAGAADLALGVSLSAPEGLHARSLGTDRFVCVARAGSGAGATDPAAFAALPHLLVSPSGWPGGPVDRALGELGLGRRVVVTVPTFAAALDLVANTDLVATLPERLVRLLPPSQLEALSVTPPPVPLAPFRLLALWHARADADPAHRWLRGLLEGV